MRCGQYPAGFPRLRIPEGRFSEGHSPEHRADSLQAAEAAVSGPSADILAAMPGEARREYLAAYRRARRLAEVKRRDSGRYRERGGERIS